MAALSPCWRWGKPAGHLSDAQRAYGKIAIVKATGHMLQCARAGAYGPQVHVQVVSLKMAYAMYVSLPVALMVHRAFATMHSIRC